MPIWGPSAAILEIFIILTVAVIGFLLCFFLKRSGRTDAFVAPTFLLWLGLSFAFFLSGMGSLLTWFGNLGIERIIDYFVNIFIQLSLIPGSYYPTLKVFGNKKFSRNVAVVFSLLTLVFLFQLFKYGLVEVHGKIIYYGLNFVPHFNAEIVTLFSLLLLVLLGFYDMSLRLIKWTREKKISDIYKFLSTLSLVLLVFAAGVNQAGWITDVKVLIFTRVIVFGIFMMAFVSFLNEEKPPMPPKNILIV